MTGVCLQIENKTFLSFTCKTTKSTTHDWGGRLINSNGEQGRQIHLAPGVNERNEHTTDLLIHIIGEITYVNGTEIISTLNITIPDLESTNEVLHNTTISCENVQLLLPFQSKY